MGISVSQTVLLLIPMTSAASVCLHFGYTLQKKAAQKLTGVQFGFKSLGAYVKTKNWVLGILTTLVGTALIIIALRIGPISTIQPLLGGGLIFLVLFSRFYLREQVGGSDYAALGLVIVGVVLLGLTTSDAHIASVSYEPRRLFGFAAVIMVAVCGAQVLLRLIFGQSKMDIRYGIFSGVFFAFASLFMRAMFNGMRLYPLATFYWFIPLAVASGVMGFSLIQRGFNHGRAVIVIIFCDIANQLTVIAGGLFCFKEKLPTEPLLFALKVFALGLLVVGSVMLSRFGRASPQAVATGDRH